MHQKVLYSYRETNFIGEHRYMSVEEFPTQYPAGYEEGPWGVRSIGMHWHVVHRHTGESQAIGVIGSRDVFRVALEEAMRRNIDIVQPAPKPPQDPPLPSPVRMKVATPPKT